MVSTSSAGERLLMPQEALIVSEKKRFPKDGIHRSRVRPSQSQKARDMYGKGFNVRGIPVTCGYPTDWGECAACIAGSGLCPHPDREYQRASPSPPHLDGISGPNPRLRFLRTAVSLFDVFGGVKSRGEPGVCSDDRCVQLTG